MVLLLFALQSGPARRFAVTRLTAFLAEQHINLQTDELRFSLFSLALDARNVRLRSSGAADLPPFTTIERARLNLSLANLLRGRYVVDSGVIENVDIQYVVDVDGRDNLPRLPANPDKTGQPLDYLIRNVSVPNARLRYVNRTQQLDVSLSLAPVQMTGNAITGRHLIRFESAGGQFQIENHVEHIDHLSGAINLGRDDLRVDALRFEAAGSRAELAGDIRDFDAPQLALELKATIDAARSSTLLGMRDPLAGAVVVAANANGPLAGLAIGARVSASALQFRSLSTGQVDARATYDGATRRVDVSSAIIKAPWGRLSGSGILALGQGRRSRLQAELTGVDTAAVMRGLNLPYVADSRGQRETRRRVAGARIPEGICCGHRDAGPGTRDDCTKNDSCRRQTINAQQRREGRRGPPSRSPRQVHRWADASRSTTDVFKASCTPACSTCSQRQQLLKPSSASQRAHCCRSP